MIWDNSSDSEDDYLDIKITEYSLVDSQKKINISTDNVAYMQIKPKQSELMPVEEIKDEHKNKKQSWLIDFFDLDLLKDKVFVNIIVGMAIAAFAEINFSVLTPFILSELMYTDTQIAGFMSSLAISDIFSRFLSPFVGDYLKFSARVMYMISLGMLIATRMSE